MASCASSLFWSNEDALWKTGGGGGQRQFELFSLLEYFVRLPRDASIANISKGKASNVK